MPRHRILLSALFLSLQFALPTAAPAWTPALQERIATDAARLAPPDLARQLARHSKELAAGAREPFTDAAPGDHYADPDGSGNLAEALRLEVDAAIDALRSRRTFAEIARRLGRVSHFAADLAFPLHASADDRAESRYYDDYLAYAEWARPRFAVVAYEHRPPLAGTDDVDRLIAEGLARGRAAYPGIGAEYRRIEFRSGIGRFDDRSTAFGVASLAYSGAVTDAARLLRYIWLTAGGADPRQAFSRARDRVLVLDQGGAP